MDFFLVFRLRYYQYSEYRTWPKLYTKIRACRRVISCIIILLIAPHWYADRNAHPQSLLLIVDYSIMSWCPVLYIEDKPFDIWPLQDASAWLCFVQKTYLSITFVRFWVNHAEKNARVHRFREIQLFDPVFPAQNMAYATQHLTSTRSLDIKCAVSMRLFIFVSFNSQYQNHMENVTLDVTSPMSAMNLISNKNTRPHYTQLRRSTV